MDGGCLTKNSKPERTERLQFIVSHDELAAIEEFQFRNRIPNRAEAVRELMRRGLASAEK
jgi:hypothetical protein